MVNTHSFNLEEKSVDTSLGHSCKSNMGCLRPRVDNITLAK